MATTTHYEELHRFEIRDDDSEARDSVDGGGLKAWISIVGA